MSVSKEAPVSRPRLRSRFSCVRIRPLLNRKRTFFLLSFFFNLLVAFTPLAFTLRTRRVLTISLFVASCVTHLIRRKRRKALKPKQRFSFLFSSSVRLYEAPVCRPTRQVLIPTLSVGSCVKTPEGLGVSLIKM